MSKLRIILPLLLLLCLALVFVFYTQYMMTDDITTAPTTTQAAVSSTTTAATTASDAPVTTEDPYLPGTPELEFESGNDGTASVVGISDKTIKNIRIPNYTPDGDRVISIAYNAFGLNTAMESIIIPANVYRIASGAFFGCTSLKTVTLSEGLEYIEYNAFQNCTALESVTFPASLKEIKSMAFSGCTSLRHLAISANNPTFTAEGNCLILKSERKLVLGCSGSKIPKDIVTVGEFAFYGAGLTELLLPDSLRVIENQAFAENPELTALDLGNSLESLGNLAFSGCDLLNNVYLPASLTEIGVTPFRNCKAMTRLTVSENNPAYYAKTLCLVRKSDQCLIEGFTGASIPDGVKAIADWAFAYTSVREISIPVGVETIGKSAFAYTSLTSLTLPKTLKEIALNAFHQVSTLKTVAFGGSQQSFEALTEGVTLPEGVSVTYGE